MKYAMTPKTCLPSLRAAAGFDVMGLCVGRLVAWRRLRSRCGRSNLVAEEECPKNGLRGVTRLQTGSVRLTYWLEGRVEGVTFRSWPSQRTNHIVLSASLDELLATEWFGLGVGECPCRAGSVEGTRLQTGSVGLTWWLEGRVEGVTFGSWPSQGNEPHCLECLPR